MKRPYNFIKSIVKDNYELFKDILPYQGAMQKAIDSVLEPVDYLNVVHPSVSFNSKQDLKDLLISELQYEVNIHENTVSGDYHTLTDNGADHHPWYREKVAADEIQFRFWNRYKKYLLNIKGLNSDTVNKLDEITDDILERIENPRDRNRSFDRRGLVVGYVQSGKTANFTGVINKSIDCGYKVIIVLSGMHKNLRSQTQMRIDEEVIGRDTSELAEVKRIGVTTLPNERYINVDTFTTQDDGGDFTRSFAQQVGGIQPGSDRPMLLVVKKNVSVLKNLVRYFRESLGTLDQEFITTNADNQSVLNNLPLLLIDDEADQASPNTRAPSNDNGELDPTAINKCIRELLNLFNQKAYIGYTATPFANIFIHHEIQHSVLGKDLFPSSFIISMEAPSNYFGPVKVFGLNDDETEQGLPIHIPVLDASLAHSDFLPLRHKSDAVPDHIPASMKEAIKSFILSSAIRRIRGQGNKHNTMLIHCTRYNDIQNAIGRYVEEEFNRLREGIINDDADILRELSELWQRDYIKISTAMNQPVNSWNQVKENLKSAVLKMERRPHVVNGSAGDILDYKNRETTGLSVIAIGGDKLSRGLTLEGLTVSYFTRASTLYDTLMQMGRWFGYRNGFEDLCRIYTTVDLYSWYRHISTAFEKLRNEFLIMSRHKATPMEFGLRVLSHPDMMETNAMKMRHSDTMKLKYQGTLTETTTIANNITTITSNYNVTEEFVASLGTPNVDSSRRIIWKDVSVNHILRFFNDFITFKGLPAANSYRIAEYIKLQINKHGPELLNWNVVLVTRMRDKEDQLFEFGGQRIAPLSRTISRPLSDTVFIQRVISKTDELLDFTKREIEAANTAKELDIRDTPAESRDAGPRRSNPLLMLYVLDVKDTTENGNDPIRFDKRPVAFAVSWNRSSTAKELVYSINTVYQELELTQYDQL